MNWGKALIAGIVGGVVLWLVDGALHGAIMASTYAKYPIFSQEGGILIFIVPELAIAISAAVLYAKTVGSWGGGVKGGMTFGLFLGVVLGFTHFFQPLTFVDFPYYLAWCWWGMSVISAVILGAVLGAIYKG